MPAQRAFQHHASGLTVIEEIAQDEVRFAMNIDNSDLKRHIESQISILSDVVASAKIFGISLGAVLVNDTPHLDASHTILCVFIDCSSWKAHTESGLPVFPLFFGAEVARELEARRLIEIIDHSETNAMHKWHVRLSETWI